jgi:hypothetical protein
LQAFLLGQLDLSLPFSLLISLDFALHELAFDHFVLYLFDMAHFVFVQLLFYDLLIL